MISRIRCCPRPDVLLVLALLLSAPAAWAGNAKVKVCHIPPGNPGNFHTITVSENALQAHLGHGDLAGACFAHCDSLCSDDDPCTIDACDSSEHCLNTHPPVNCNDGNLCTVDSCSSEAGGCQNTTVACADGNNCTVDACDPMTGSCVFPAVECPPGQTCNPAQTNPVCEAETVTCPCIEGLPGWLAIANSTVTACEDSLPFAPYHHLIFLTTAGGLVVSQAPAIDECGFYGSSGFIRPTPEETQACIDFLRAKAAAANVPCVVNEPYY